MRLLFSTALLLAGCVASPGGRTTFESGTAMDAETSSPGASSESTAALESSSGSSESTGPGGPNLDVAAPDTDGNAGEIAEVFGHSGDTLYRMDADTKEVTTVGAFTGVVSGSIIDIALDADSNMYGTSYGALYSIDKQTAACTLIAMGSYPTSLSFVPAGTVDLDEEALVGYVEDEYVRIDVDTGAISTIGSLSGGLVSSGDIVSVKDGGTYLTVEGPPCVKGDCLIEVDPVTGALEQNFGELPWAEVFGLGFWGGTAYGFARDGTLFSVEFMPDDSLSTTSIEIPDGAAIEWFGAGSTTSAPPAEG